MEEDNKLEYDIQKRARAGTAATARIAVALYIVWLGYKIIQGVQEGNTSMPAAVGWLTGVSFIVVAIAFGFYIWKRYRKDLEDARIIKKEENKYAKDIDDPDNQ